MNLEYEPDIVEVILRACQAEGFDPDVARLIESKIRTDYGGQRVRIPKRRKHPTEQERLAAYEDGLTSMPTDELTEKHRISRATLYRLMKKLKSDAV